MLVSRELNAAYWALRVAFGLGPLLAGRWGSCSRTSASVLAGPRYPGRGPARARPADRFRETRDFRLRSMRGPDHSRHR